MPDREHGNNHRINNTDDQDTICFELPEKERQPQQYNNYREQHQQQYTGYREQHQQQYNGYQQQPQQQYNGYREQPQQQYNGYREQHQQQYSGYREQPQQQYNGYREQHQQQYSGYREQPQQQYSGYQQQAPPPPPQGGYYPPPYHSPRPPEKKRKRSGSKPSRDQRPSQPPIRQNVKKVRKKHHRSLTGKIIRRVILSLLSIFLLLFGIYSCTSLTLISKINRVSTGERTRTSGTLSRSYVRSVLIIGTDGRSDLERGRSDSMILISLNKNTNKIYMTSFMRDCNVSIPGYGENKLNAAYSFGGPELLMDTIESNFRVKIDDYIQVNFSTFASLIDAAGGIDMELSDAEAEALNVILISEVNELMGDERESDLLPGGGKHHLNGKQALSYSRIRNVGNYDFERTSRQRRVITALIKKARSGGISFVRKVAKGALPSMTTNMSTGELYLLSLRLPFLLKYDTEQLQIPAEGTFSDDPNNPNGWVIEVDFDANYDIIRETVFSK